MKTDHYKATIAEYEKWAGKRVVVLLAVMHCLYGIICSFRGNLDPLLALPLMLTVVIPALFVAIWIHKQHFKYDSLVCPHCHESLYNSWMAVTASHECPSCGGQVLDSPDS